MIKNLRTPIVILLSLTALASCRTSNFVQPAPTPVSTTPTSTSSKLYFPPISGTTWTTETAASLGWDQTQLTNLYPYLESKGTKALIILKDGKIVTEHYFGTFTTDSLWYWASAGKTVTAMLIGIAQEDGLININNKTSTYIGTGWTSEPLDKEDLITIKSQLTMTTGLDDGVADQ